MTDPPPTSNDSSAPRRFKCAIDRTILNDDTVSDLNDIGQSIFAPLCGRNRGAFVLDPPDGHTYGCVAFPENFAQLAGLTASSNGTTAIPDISDSNAIVLQFQAGNLTASDAVDLLDLYAQLVYNSTPDVEKLPYGCDAGGLAVLECGDDDLRPSPMEGGGPIRAATLAGVFVPAPWATGGQILTLDEASGFYTAKDFDEMREFGLNAVQIPVPLDAFLVGANDAPVTPPQSPQVEVETPNDAPATSSSSVVLVEEEAKDENVPNSPVLGKHSPPASPASDEVEAGGEDQTDPLSISVQSVLEDMLNMVSGAGLRAIIVLVGGEDVDADNTKAVGAASTFAASRGDAVLALTLPSASGDVVAAARAAPLASNLPLFLPVNGGDLLDLTAGGDDDANVYASLDMEHSSTVADVASSTSVDDRMKMFYHEATACTTRSPIEYAGCYRGVPAFVSGGFDLSVDDCAMKVEKAADFGDYGQCDRFDETVGSPWWERHRSSFAARQVSSYERGLGWSYTAWKLYDAGDVETGTGASAAGVNDTAPGALDIPAKLLCLRDVAAAGLMPPLSVNGTDGPSSPSAPLACLNPPVSDFILGDATLAPTPGPPPDCGNGWWNASTGKCDYWVPPPPVPCKPSKKGIGTAAGVGAVVGFVVGAVVVKACGIGKRSGYSTLPLT